MVATKMAIYQEHSHSDDWSNGRRLQDLEEQLSNLKESIAKLTGGSAPSPKIADIRSPGFNGDFIGFAASSPAKTEIAISSSNAVGTNPAHLVRAALVRSRLRHRRLRESLFSSDLFADPAWDMLLDLYAAELEEHDVSVSSLCIAAAVPTTTALRWIKMLSQRGWLSRCQDPNDGRRINMRLSDDARARLDRYFDDLAK